MAAKKRVAPEYSPAVRARFDVTRPKYTEAVKSLAAFAEKMTSPLVFGVLVHHLDAAVAEARAHIVNELKTAAKRRKR